MLGEFLWAGSLIFFLASSLIFYFLIEGSWADNNKARSALMIVRVALLDGLFLIMGITLGVCICIVSEERVITMGYGSV